MKKQILNLKGKKLNHLLILLSVFLTLPAILIAQTTTTWNLNGNNPGTGKFLGTTTAKDLIIKTNNSEAMRIKGTTGSDNHFIGIGMDPITMPNPLNQFHVHNGTIHITGNNNYGGPMILFGGILNQPDQVGEWGIEYTNQPSNNGLNFWKPWPSNNNGNYFLFLSDNGNVGVNTNNPTARFTVNGKTLLGDPAVVNINTVGNYNLYVQNGILTEKLRVSVVNSATWADYVFDKDYKLKNLDEVDAFIKANKHLPGVPGAKEVEKEGVDMVDMDSRLLEKIEELTLYVIQQDKRIDLLEKKLSDK